MKKIILFVLMAVFSVAAMAQQNLRDGYVITLQGDTLQGVIDFRTASMNTKRCVFKQNGATEFKTYLPGDIDGYRFINNGIYYVSKPVIADDGSRELVFAEYVIRGNMSLYQIGADEMVIVDEDGNEASFSLESAKNATNVQELRHEISDVLVLLNKSDKATQMLWNATKSRDNTKKAVMTYVDEVCTDGYCEVFEYKSKNTPKEDRIAHPWVKAGMKITKYNFWNGNSLTGVSPQISAGADFHFNRLLRGFMVNAGVMFEPGRASTNVNKHFQGEPSVKLNGTYLESLKYNQLDFIIGLGYQFQTGPVKTRVNGGYIYRPMSRNFTYTDAVYYFRGTEYGDPVTRHEYDMKFEAPLGLYGGIGVEYPLKNCSLVCDLEYVYDNNNGPVTTAGVEVITKKIKQHGLCLSVGVKF